MLTVLTHADGIHTPGCPVLPESMTTEQLYGTFVKHEWKDGVLPVLFRRQSKLSSTNSLRQQRQRHSPLMNASTSASNVGAVNAVKADKPEAHEHWIVMDGTVVMDRLNTVLDNNNQLCLNNGETIPLQSNMRMIFETDCLTNVTPATVSRVGIVHVPSSTITWDQLFEGWVQSNQKKEDSLSCNWDKSMVKSVKDLFQWLGKLGLDHLLWLLWLLWLLLLCLIDL